MFLDHIQHLHNHAVRATNPQEGFQSSFGLVCKGTGAADPYDKAALGSNPCRFVLLPALINDALLQSRPCTQTYATASQLAYSNVTATDCAAR